MPYKTKEARNAHEAKVRRRPHVIAYKSQWYQNNKARISAVKRVRRPETLESERLYLSDPKHAAARKSRMKKYGPAYYKKNRALLLQKMKAYYERRREHIIARVARWNARNPEKVRVLSRVKAHRRIARHKQAPGNFSTVGWRDRFLACGQACWYCTKPLSLEEASPDHRIPLSRGGTNWLSNIVPSCLSCNHSKSARTEPEYFEVLARREVRKEGI